MIIEDGKFYFIKDNFFDLFEGYKLMENKENGNKRPCYFCFKDNNEKDIIWFVPISTKHDKYEKIYESKKKKQKLMKCMCKSSAFYYSYKRYFALSI